MIFGDSIINGLVGAAGLVLAAAITATSPLWMGRLSKARRTVKSTKRLVTAAERQNLAWVDITKGYKDALADERNANKRLRRENTALRDQVVALGGTPAAD